MLPTSGDYQNYCLQQKREALRWFLLAMSLLDAVPLMDEPRLDYELIFYWLLTLLMFLLSRVKCKLHILICALVAATAIVKLIYLPRLHSESWSALPAGQLCWMTLFAYLVYIITPFAQVVAVIFNLVMCASYIYNRFLFAHQLPSTQRPIAADLIALIGTNILGFLAYSTLDNQQWTAFLESWDSLKMKLSIEEESAEQERLLLSVLPEHVAVKMRQDLGTALDTQFKKIYMSRHENVSILYADIVGFTAISSTYSASELVKILNELFARFDRLSEKYHQLRIKILGDCYYCISGAPQQRPDHAILSVHMGLSMVEAIKYVQQTTNSPVDMRVGIHTGAVLAGVLGQRQWQFDVYSKDVELANKMESSGLPGRVHISEKTLSYLNGEFEVEPAHGEQREETLKLAGIKTFFIVKALQPYEVENLEVEEKNNSASEKDDENDDYLPNITDKRGIFHFNCIRRKRSRGYAFRKRLKKELTNRNEELRKQTNIVTLSFKDTKKEKAYQRHLDTSSRISITGCPIALFTSFLALALNFKIENSLFTWIMLFSITTVGFSTYQTINKTALSVCPERSETFFNIVLLFKICTFVIVTGTVLCYLGVIVWFSYDMRIVSEEYFTHCSIPILIAISLITQWSYVVKFVYLLSAIILLNLINLYAAPSITKSYWMQCTQVFFISICLVLVSRHLERWSRMVFLWKMNVEEQREKASDIVRRNEALVYNILPKHVATHFLGNKKRQYDELYSQSYAEVGVLFASMPNFADFYSEESVNNQGLECLRFLNEVISDFDALLELPKFHDIIKIKTIGSTYMAASGLNPTKVIQPDDPIEVRWAHLALLVEFALELKKALQGINEQSFNHFTLQMGINHGPIIAGVIGARKPHYDIWGNSVNVASRMESTGRAGYIQVTEETCKILQHFGYEFEQRGLVAVKGKGQLMTYYLLGKADSRMYKLPSCRTANEEEGPEENRNANSPEIFERQSLLKSES